MLAADRGQNYLQVNLEQKILLDLSENPDVDLREKYGNIVSQEWMKQMLSNYGIRFNRKWIAKSSHFEQALLKIKNIIHEEVNFTDSNYP